jgi:hypothetical protein
MNNKANRVARLTSSKISVLLVDGKGKYGFGAGAITYLNQKLMELDLGRGITLPINKWEMNWGKLWEVWVHWQLGSEYELIIDRTTINPKMEWHSGSEDFQVKIEGGCISELKCYHLENHYKYSKCLHIVSLVWPLFAAYAEPTTKLSERARQKQIARWPCRELDHSKRRHHLDRPKRRGTP